MSAKWRYNDIQSVLEKKHSRKKAENKKRTKQTHHGAKNIAIWEQLKALKMNKKKQREEYTHPDE